MNEKSNRLLFAAIAADDTGASDLAGRLKEQGVVTLFASTPASHDCRCQIKAIVSLEKLPRSL